MHEAYQCAQINEYNWFQDEHTKINSVPDCRFFTSVRLRRIDGRCFLKVRRTSIVRDHVTLIAILWKGSGV